jgi:hypothetical protein
MALSAPRSFYFLSFKIHVRLRLNMAFCNFALETGESTKLTLPSGAVTLKCLKIELNAVLIQVKDEPNSHPVNQHYRLQR